MVFDIFSLRTNLIDLKTLVLCTKVISILKQNLIIHYALFLFRFPFCRDSALETFHQSNIKERSLEIILGCSKNASFISIQMILFNLTSREIRSAAWQKSEKQCYRSQASPDTINVQLAALMFLITLA